MMKRNAVPKKHRWGVVLAGGDGKRLLPLTRRINGDERPKQFSAVLGNETLLDQTRRRVASIIKPHQTLLMLTQTHERYFAKQVHGMPPSRLVVQPYNHGTSQAILFSLLRVRQSDPDGIVAFLPSDHHFADDQALAQHMEMAFTAAQSHPQRVVLLGVEPQTPETSYGWIEPCGMENGTVFQVRKFWEKPSSDMASLLMRRGCLWNSFVMVGRVDAFLRLFERTMPELRKRFEEIQPALSTPAESDALTKLYDATAASNFSEDVLTKRAEDLMVLPGKNLGWSDLGEPERVYSVMNHSREPELRMDWARVGDFALAQSA